MLASVLAACQSDGETPQPDATPTPTQPSLGDAALSAHRFLPVGESTSLEGLGIVLETVALDDGAISYNEASATVTCHQGGRGFVRVRYREAPTVKNEIQTIAVVCIDELGDCTGLTRVSYDFERYLDQEPRGEADYLTQGEGLLYGVCLSEDRYRLQQPPPMPPLLFRRHRRPW